MEPLLSRFVRQQRINAILPYLRGDILDLGFGWARLAEHLQEGQTYTGVDHHPQALEIAWRDFPQHTFLRRDLESDALDLGERRFDTVVMTAVIEHLRDPENVLRQIPDYLAQDGVFIVTTPSPGGDFIHRFGAKLFLFYQEAVDQHQHIYDRASLVRLIEKFKFKVICFRALSLGLNQLIVCRLKHE